MMTKRTFGSGLVEVEFVSVNVRFWSVVAFFEVDVFGARHLILLDSSITG
jgi:hypothetical protein